MLFEVLGPNEITRGMDVDRNEKRFEDCTLMYSKIKVIREIKTKQ